MTLSSPPNKRQKLNDEAPDASPAHDLVNHQQQHEPSSSSSSSYPCQLDDEQNCLRGEKKKEAAALPQQHQTTTLQRLDEEEEDDTTPHKEPLRLDDLPPHLKEVVVGLLDGFIVIDDSGEVVYAWCDQEELVERWTNRLEKALEKYPILAHVALKTNEQASLTPHDERFCFLYAACDILDMGHYDEATKGNLLRVTARLIELNPYALVWDDAVMISIAAGFDRAEFSVFLTIVSKYSWVFGLSEEASEEFTRNFMWFLSNASERWDWEAVTELLKSQPKMLELDLDGIGYYPLHCCTDQLSRVVPGSSTTCKAAFNFMVKEFPTALLKQDDQNGDTPLHFAFDNFNGANMARDETDNNAYYQNCISVAKILLQGNPSALLLKNKDGLTPLECIGHREYVLSQSMRPRGYAQESVRAFVVEVLREYFPGPLTDRMKEIPYLKEAHSLLQQEATFARNCVHIKRAFAVLDMEENTDKAKCYPDWAWGQLVALSTKIKTIQETDIPTMGKRFDENHVDG